MNGGFSTEQFSGEHGEKNPNRHIPLGKCREILRDCRAYGVAAIEFTGGGEPTVHKNCWGIIDYAQALGLETGLVTNGVRLQDAPIEVLRKLKWLRISLDAGTPNTYEEIRRSPLWRKAIAGIELATSLGKDGPLVGVGYVVTKENYSELYHAAKMLKQMKVPYIRVSAMFSSLGEGYYTDILSDIRCERRMAKRLEDDNFKVIDFFENRIQDLHEAKPNYSFCGYQQFVVYIGGDQKVYTCCTNAYTKHGEVGDLRDMSFGVWLASKQQYNFDARSCHHCQFNEKNRVIEYLIREEPSHVNFV
jgi:MoaA/NifB/PqqE/SkfB family radical SAM enzyme